MAINYDLAAEGGMKVFGDGGEDSAGVVQFKSAAAGTPALSVGGGVVGTTTVAALRIEGSSAASAALIQFAGGFISLTSIQLTTLSPWRYVIPVSCGAFVGGIPVLSLATLTGAAAF